MRPSETATSPYLLPALLSLVSITGLVGALVSDGAWNTFSCVLVCIPAVAFVTGLLRKRR